MQPAKRSDEILEMLDDPTVHLNEFALHSLLREVERLLKTTSADDQFALMVARAGLFERLGKHHEALIEYRELARRAPTDCWVANNLADLLVSDHPEEAVKWFEHAMCQPDGNNALVVANFARALFECGRYDEARARLDAAIDLMPAGEALIRCRLATVAAAMELPSSAVSLFADFLSLRLKRPINDSAPIAFIIDNAIDWADIPLPGALQRALEVHMHMADPADAPEVNDVVDGEGESVAVFHATRGLRMRATTAVIRAAESH